MELLKCKTDSGLSEIYIGLAWEKVKELIDPAKTIIISDSNIRDIYHKNFPESTLLIINPGEKSKSLKTVEAIIADMLKLEVDRSWFLLGIGGGVVSDITGFVASIYLRGINFGIVSTSLLSQVDASTGGKTGVNSSGYKNTIGSFNQPEFVICDPLLLKTLPDDEFKSGLGELVKHALILDEKLFSYLEKSYSEVEKNNTVLLEDLVTRSIKIKLSVVQKDEKELGPRRLLNFGHTIGHAIESVTHQKHGIAIAMGMYFSALYSCEKEYISGSEFERIRSLLMNLDLISDKPVLISDYLAPVLRDKKRETDLLHFVVLKGIGKSDIEDISIRALMGWMEKQM